jgi:hypothetical protein
VIAYRRLGAASTWLDLGFVGSCFGAEGLSPVAVAIGIFLPIDAVWASISAAFAAGLDRIIF